MTTFVDLYFPPGLPFDRDEVEAAVESDLGTWVDVVGAGTGATGSNLDLELRAEADLDAVLARLVETLTRLGIPATTVVAMSDPPERVTLAELANRVRPPRDIRER